MQFQFDVSALNLILLDIIEIELIDDSRLRSSRIKKEINEDPSEIIVIIMKTRRVSFADRLASITTKISVITKQMTLPKQHISPITNAGETGWVTSVANANATGTTGTIMSPPLTANTNADQVEPWGTKAAENKS